MTDNAKLQDFLRAPGVIFDVRSPGEYVQGHIPGAVSLPLFDNTERAEVGTIYKQTGKREAIELGLRIVGPKLADFVGAARLHGADSGAKVFCWRGGMRSASMAWLLRTAGMSTVTLSGGYKSFRRWVLSQFAEPRKFLVLGGLTGSGKTSILHVLRDIGEQVLDLEALACHRGSCYGSIGMPTQPSNEHFENLTAMKLRELDPEKPIWIEDESRTIGKCCIPNELFRQMRSAPLTIIERSFQERVDILLRNYGSAQQELVEGTQKLSKRLGGKRTTEAVNLISDGRLHEAMEIVLKYYDSAYKHSLERLHEPVHRIDSSGLTDLDIAKELIKIENIRR